LALAFVPLVNAAAWSLVAFVRQLLRRLDYDSLIREYWGAFAAFQVIGLVCLLQGDNIHNNTATLLAGLVLCFPAGIIGLGGLDGFPLVLVVAAGNFGVWYTLAKAIRLVVRGHRRFKKPVVTD
jgi:hypothetical protein